MKKAILLLVIILTILNCKIVAHSGKPDYYIIIDTDCAIDDLRAITLLLASSKVQVLGITTSDGTLDPENGQVKVESLLSDYHHEGIPVAIGERVLEDPPEWRELNQKIYWSKEERSGNIKNDLNAADFIIDKVKSEKEPVTVICLGSLYNIARAIQKEDSIRKQIQRIIWFNKIPDIINGTNYKFDTKSADYVLNSGINIDIVSNPDKNIFKVDNIIMDSISEINSIYARKIVEVHQQKALKNSEHKGYLNLWDDLVPVYLTSSMIFRIDSFYEYNNVRIVTPVDPNQTNTQIIDILSVNKYVNSKIFLGFPVDPVLYQEDVVRVMNEIIKRHGLEEWRLGVLTNELHGHLGIYAIIGAKMGLRAREFFNIGIDDIKVITYAGRKTPLSCMNDGLQVSTGGTLGHGLIFLADDAKTIPMAVLSYKDRTVIIKLKDEYINIVRNDIKNCISEHGNLTEEYWSCVRRLAIEYWLKWDRNIMFNLEY
jgi:inosine-uridine nucleoside N-ribohydrolase/formylmethanofuran dehydrogenase subunit E